jgi:hypothetical protein
MTLPDHHQKCLVTDLFGRDSIDRAIDDLDEAVADIIHDHRPSTAPGHKVNRVIGILDQLEKENANRRFIS